MRRGFTILELLVASLLLSMLVTILTMLFNQSSIAWRTGLARTTNLDDIRRNVAAIRDGADNIYLWNNQPQRILSLWDDMKGTLRTRAWNVDAESSGAPQDAQSGTLTYKRNLNEFTIKSVGSGQNSNNRKTYIVNVMSDGPDREPNTYDDIWSFPDDIN